MNDIDNQEISDRCPNPSGLCECGCGEMTEVVAKTQASKGRYKGCHGRFVSGHQARMQRHFSYEIDETTGCITWGGRLNGDGYAIMTIGGDTVRVHKLMWESRNGRVPDGLVLDHLCRNRACINPDHLEAVTPAENVRRGALTRLRIWEVRVIKRSLATGEVSLQDVADTFGISLSHAYGIAAGRRWADVA